MKSLPRPHALLLGAALALGVAAPSLAAPVAEELRGPVDVRRTTLIVRDIDRSLPFWRDALGLTVVYDEVIERPGRPEDPPGTVRSMRLVLMRANDTFVGAVGLLEYISPRRPDPGMGEDRAGIGDFIMVVNAADLDARWERVKAVPGVKVVSEPERIEYPAPGGGVIPVMVTMVRDPDGYFVELNQILGKPAGAPQ
jgi:catechol 2,3-dioxygenase-like lactoylglutathione lyase family enzyme